MTTLEFPAHQGSCVSPNRDPSLPALREDIDYELAVSFHRDTLWLNAADGSCIGRFSKRFGIDVHHSATAQMAGSGECVFCTHAPAGAAEWEQFRNAVEAQYGIRIRPDLLSFN